MQRANIVATATCTAVVAVVAFAAHWADATRSAGAGTRPASAVESAQFPVPSALPPHSWATVGNKTFIHGCNADGLFNATGLAMAARFPLMTARGVFIVCSFTGGATPCVQPQPRLHVHLEALALFPASDTPEVNFLLVEKGQGVNLPGYADGKMAAVAAQWKEARRARGLPEGWALFYLNAWFDWPFFELNTEMEAHPTWAAQRHDATAGSPCLNHGDGEFPQPKAGMLCFNMSIPDARAAFINACVNATRHGFDGCFVDSAGGSASPAAQAPLARKCNTSLAAAAAVGSGKLKMLAELQSAVGNGKLIVAKDGFSGGSESLVNSIFPMDTFCSCYSCTWDSTKEGATYRQICQTQIQLAIRLGNRGQVVLLHGQVNGMLANNATALYTDYVFSLAAFLITSSESSFFGYSNKWYFNGTIWHGEFDRPLGEPTGPAVQGQGADNMSWTRAFASGTRVHVDVLRHTASIQWA